MAVWQATFHLVPRDAPSVPELAWSGRETPRAVDELCDAVLPRARHWGQDAKLWGDHQSHCIEAYYVGQALDSIQVRLDLRAPNCHIIAQELVSIARALQCDLVSSPTLRIAADNEAMAGALEGSPAMRFVKDPVFFLNRVRLGGVDDA
jgi:hypothetical protein